MKYQAVLFDMDGTVLDTLDDLYDSVNRSLAEFSLPPVSKAHVRRCLGNGAAYLVSHSVPAGCSPELEAEVLAFYKPWYDAHCLIKTAPYEGILPMMHALKKQGLRLAIISNKPDRAVQELWGRLVLYDACSLGTSGIPHPARGTAHERATDRTTAFKAFMRMLRAMVRRAAHDVEAFAARRSHSVRPCRGHPRRRRSKSPPRSGYRH